jgi:long-chain acyl-CoA synthetase
MEAVTIRGLRTLSWKNQPPTLRDVFLLGRGFAQREFLIYESERVTYDAFARAALTLAQEFQLQGVRKGDRIAIIMRNLPEWPVAFFAASVCGAIVTPLNAWWTGPELEYALSNSGSKMAVVDSDRYDRIAAHIANCSGLERIYVTRGNQKITHPKISLLESVLGSVAQWDQLLDLPLPNVLIEPDDDATIFYTSGTTGKPKGALGTHRNICSNVGTSAFVAARGLLRRGEAVPIPMPDDPQKIGLLVVPLFHVTGCSATLIPAVTAGNKLVLMHKWDAEKALQLIERERVTGAGGVPTIAWQLVEHPAREQYDLSSLETVSYGGAPSAPELVRRIKAVFPQAKAGNGWGMTETSASFCGNLGEDYERRPDSCGPAAPVSQLKIMTVDGTRELPLGEVGELWAKGPQIIKGYWQMPEATASTFIDGWVKTGDLARLDAEGFCFIVDRAKDILIRGGENIYCIQVENVLYEHPAVVDAALIGIPHRTLGEEPGAVVHLKPGMHVTVDELRAFVATRLAAFQVPVQIKFWPEPLPRNPAGKILKKDLKAVFTRDT